MKHIKEITKNASYRIGFTLIEIIFAVLLLAFFIYFIANSFVTTKRQHSMNAEYITKAYVADIVIKMLKERIEVNPNFLVGINGLEIPLEDKAKSASCMVNPMSGNISYPNLFDRPGYKVDIKGIPVISYTDTEKKEGYYFGIVAFNPDNNLFSPEAKGFKTFLNVEELEKYSYDLTIENDLNSAPVGMVKNIDVEVFFNGGKNSDDKPFKLTTKIVCPISSLSSAAYGEIQKNLFKEIATDIYENINADMERRGFSLNLLVAGIERDCKASPYTTMKIINLSMPESAPDRPRAEEAFKNVLVLHCALELYRQAVDEIDADLKRVEGKNDVISIVKVMDNSIQKSQWALQVFEATFEPIDKIIVALKPGGIAPPNPDAIFNYQVPIMIMRYLLSRSENDPASTRLDRFVGIAEKLPIDYSQSLEVAFKRVNELLRQKYKKLTARQIQKYSKDLLSFHQLVRVNGSRLHISGYSMPTQEYTRQASETIELITDFYRRNNFLAGAEFLESESIKIRQINSLVATRFAEIIKKIERFNQLGQKLKKLEKEVLNIDVVARGQEEVKLVSAPYEVNMEELSQVYITRGRQAVEEYLERCEREYYESLRN